MPHRYRDAAPPLSGALPATALRQVLRSGYSAPDLRADLLAGLVVGVVALPLSMALAIASGVPPQHGLYTAIVAGALIALLGGSRVQVSGPTAAFVVVLSPIAARHGIAGLLVASVLAGVILILLGALGMGKLIEFIPNPVTTGFTAGIAVVIATLQIKDFLGLSIATLPEHFLPRAAAIVHGLPQARWQDAAIGCLTLAILLLWPRVTRKIPSPLVALSGGAVAAAGAGRIWPGFQVATIGSRFSSIVDGIPRAGIPRHPPSFVLPWAMAGPDGAPLGLSFGLIHDLLGPAFAIAMLGAIESLLSAVVADGMTGDQHDSNAELMGQGLGNIIAPFFGGFAATGAIARTATNVRYGARSPFAAVCHAGFLLAVVVSIAPVLAWLPMASLAALLLVVAKDMSEVKHALHTLAVAPRSDAFVMAACFVLTVAFDMVVAVSAGVLLAAVLFMRKMAELSRSELLAESHPEIHPEHASRLVVYEVAGPLFFGAAQKFVSTLRRVRKNVTIVVLDLRAVPVMDATGLVSLESAVARLRQGRIDVYLAGVQRQPLELLLRAGFRAREGVTFHATFEDALRAARERLDGMDAGRAGDAAADSSSTADRGAIER